MKQGYLTIRQAAEYLDVSPSTLRRWHQKEVLVPEIVDHTNNYRYYSINQLSEFRERNFETHYQTSPLKRVSFRFIDLFAGIGGLRLGFRKYGRCVFSSEIDRFACDTYEANFGERPEGDITEIHASSIPRHDILLAGFPCQPFSIAGVSKYGSLGREHGFKDQTKGTLFFHVLRIIDYHRPEAFLLENVKNLKSHDSKKTFQIITESLKELGYTIYHKILDAQFIVPQHRERVFIVGFRERLRFDWPVIENREPKLKDIMENDVPAKYTLSDHLWSYLQEYAKKHQAKGNGFGYGLADLKGITRTLSARYYKDGSEILIPQNGANPRRLTPRECARLMGFPDDFKIPVSDTQAYRQFGNAVVASLVEILAESICTALWEKREPEPEGQLALNFMEAI